MHRVRSDSLRRGRPVLAVLIVAGAIALAGPPASALLPPHRPPADEVMGFFDHVALNRGGSSGYSRPGEVRKLSGPVAITVIDDDAPGHLDRIGDVAATLSDWTDLRFYLSQTGQPGHDRIIVHIMPLAQMRRLYGHGGPVCFTRTWGRRGRLHTVFMQIADQFADCLAHEFMHAVGFDNHWTGPAATGHRPSVLAMRHSPARAKSFSIFDEVAIRLLYDRRLIPGTPRAEALPTARRILAEDAD